ncbi:MAG: carbamoyl phosphate synthase small subunit [Oscillospiraceae bacterium]|nr:carbamoyl phosphate synthase small subunit [Oscillospiraceae bacterium]
MPRKQFWSSSSARTKPMSKVYIILENGRVFEGESFGAEGDAVGELVFTTGVVGYVETLTDPSYAGQIIMHTFPEMGNYGIIHEDYESWKCHARGVVVRNWCKEPSNFRCEGTLDSFLKSQGVVGICGVDTREITQLIRETGVMNAMITKTRPEGVPDTVKSYTVTGVVAETSAKSPYIVAPKGEEKYSVALIDYGAKRNIIRELAELGCKVTVFPYNAEADEILATRPDGVMLSNGPGDPAENVGCIKEIRELLGKVPIFGICLGHQLMALAAGGKTEKLRYGHRGGNQPVRSLDNGRVYITSQNHGYAVISDSLESNVANLSYVNLNDNTCEGLDYPSLKAFSLQFHPEAHCGPRDMRFVFKKFLNLMDGGVQ